MLRTDLIELVNRGDMWAFVGSGASVDAGCPSWEGLIQSAVTRLGESARQRVLSDERYKRALSMKRFAQCFSRIEAHVGREAMEEVVASQLDSVTLPGKITSHLADWPLAGYITTNYDELLEIALREIGERGWLSVGNSADEVRKVAGDATRVTWHLHGGTRLPRESFRMVLTEKDYDDLYLDGSPMVTQLRGLLAHRRVVFVGFGFEDVEVMRLLKLVGRLCSPARPAFAFLSGLSGTKHEPERLDLLERYNIDVIPYRVVNGSHEQLLQLLEVYSALILRRSLRFGQPERPCPSYDPETTGLLVYNQLALRHQGQVAGEVLGSLLKARIIALLKHRGPLTIEALGSDLTERIRLIEGEERSTLISGDSLAAVKKCLDDLASAGLVEIPAEPTGASVVSISTVGASNIDGHAAAARRLSEQFSACLHDRARESFPGDPEARRRVAHAAESFLKECIKRRALGVAMAWNSPRVDFQHYHIVALLQALPEFLAQLTIADEGLALVRLVEGVLARPSEAETKYLGVALQAQFGVNLLGYDPETIEARSRELSRTLFLIDSSTMIPLLARSSIGYHLACLLLQQLGAAGSMVATTQLLATEVAEHARWAVSHVAQGTTPLTPGTLSASTGRAGSRSNAFLEGFLEEVSLGQGSLNLGAYLDSVCGHPEGHTATDDAFIVAIRNAGVPCMALHEWEGFTQEIWAERDALQEQIANRRKTATRPTYKHERQVRAEAGALIIVRNIRSGTFKSNGQTMADAYFISNTRAIDDVAGPGLPITMRPVAVLQWLSTVTACPAEELGFLFNSLLLELSERGLAIVDRTRLQAVFSPLVVASRAKLHEETETHRVLIARRFGEDPSKAFKEVSELDMPIVVHSYYAQRSVELEEQLKEEKKAKEALQAQAKLTEKERQKFEILQQQEKQRKLKARSRERAAASRPGRKRKKKKKRR